MEFYIYSFLFLLITTFFSYLVVKFISKTKKDNLGFWFLFLLTTKTLLFYAFLQLVLLKNIVFNLRFNMNKLLIFSKKNNPLNINVYWIPMRHRGFEPRTT